MLTAESRSQSYCHMLLAPSPASTFPQAAICMDRWGMEEAALPWPLCSEEGMLEAGGVGLRSVGCAWSAQDRLGQTAHCAVGKLQTGVIQELSITLCSQATSSVVGPGDGLVQLFLSPAALGITSIYNPPMLRLPPRVSDVRAWVWPGHWCFSKSPRVV